MRRRLALLVLVSFCACPRAVGPPGRESLLGLTLPLRPTPALTLAVAGAVFGKPAELQFDPSQPVSFVSAACVPDGFPHARVKVPDAFGPDETFPLTRVDGLALGGERFRAFEAATAAGKACVVVFGAPELRDVALEVNPASRTLAFVAPRAREAWAAEAQASGADALVLPLSREPRFDWPLLTVRLRQGPQRADFPMLLSLREPKSRVFDEPARASGLRPGLELLDGLPLPAGVALPKELAQLRAYAWDALELAPGFGLSDGVIDLEPGTPPHAALGVLGADVWGRFHAVYDVPAAVLVLRRPRVFEAGARVQCERGGAVSEEACFELAGRPAEGGLDVTVTVWRPLRDGVRLSLDVPGAPQTGCRIGVAFSPGDRGRSTQHHFPWAKLGESIPSCAGAFEGATGVAPGLMAEGVLEECPGVCAYARDGSTGRLSCECQAGVRTGKGEAERQLLELFKKALERRGAPAEQEPVDP